MHNKNILISPYSQPIDGLHSPKDWGDANWKELVFKLKETYDMNVLQIGTFDEAQIKGTDIVFRSRPFEEIKKLVQNSRLVISVDNFLPHLCKDINKKCVVIWGPSDSNIFGYKENLNIHGNREHLRKHQLHLWKECEQINKEAFPTVEEVLRQISYLIG